MITVFTPLAVREFPECIAYVHTEAVALARVSLDSLALEVMIPPGAARAATMDAGESVLEAEHRMRQGGLGQLLVVDAEQRVVGLVTLSDVLGEKPVQIAFERQMHRDEVMVRNIMTPREELLGLTLEQVRAAKVGNILATLYRKGRRHVLVTERNGAHPSLLCGIFSMERICQRLHIAPQESMAAASFADIEARLLH